jgi:protein-S-isoprenylcysteine O-methyltransferase Ste14
MASPAGFLWILWGAWLLSWLVAARWSSAIAVRQSGADQVRHSVFIWVGALLVFAKPAVLGPLLHPLYPAAPWLIWTGVALAVVGLGATWWARIHLGKDWSAAVTLKENHALVRSGPYALTRHPIYSGLLLAFAGTVLVEDAASAWLGFALVTFGFVLKLRQEERLLTAHFGETYKDYQARVRALIPGIW